MCDWSNNVPIKTEVIQENIATPKIEADIKPKVEPSDEISNVNTRGEIQKWINQIEFKIEADVKPKIEVDIKPKIEPSGNENEEINNGMEIISSMNIPATAEIQAQYIYLDSKLLAPVHWTVWVVWAGQHVLYTVDIFTI